MLEIVHSVLFDIYAETFKACLPSNHRRYVLANRVCDALQKIGESQRSKPA